MKQRSYFKALSQLACMLLAATVLAAPLAAEKPVISMALDRDDGVYDKGEQPELTIKVDSEALAAGEWVSELTWRHGWNGEPQSIEWKPSGKEEVFRIPASGTGLILVEALMKGKESGDVLQRASIGALLNPKGLKPATAEPDDFDEFWSDQLAAWREIPQAVTITPVDSTDEAVESWEIEIKLEGEVTVYGYISRPAGWSGEKLPAVLSLHGAGFRSSNLPLTLRFAKQGFLAMDINAHGFLNNQPKEYYEREGERLRNFRREGVRSRDTWYFRTMFLRIITATDYLTSREEWNGDDLVLYGSSQGGAQVMAGAALDPRVTVLAASVPAMCDMAAAIEGRVPGWPRTLPVVNDEESTQQVLKTLSYFDGVNFAPRIKAAAIVSNGLIDRTCPADGIQIMTNRLPNEDVEVLYRPAMGHAIPWEIQVAFMEFIKARVTLN